MEIIKNFNRDVLLQVKLILYKHCSEYALVNANDSDDIYCILNDVEEVE